MSTQKPAAPPEQKKGEVNELRTVSIFVTNSLYTTDIVDQGSESTKYPVLCFCFDGLRFPVGFILPRIFNSHYNGYSDPFLRSMILYLYIYTFLSYVIVFFLIIFLVITNCKRRKRK